MSDQETPVTNESDVAVETPTAETPATEAPAKTPVVRRPALVVKFADGTEKPLLRYAFPVKANTFNVKVNGVDCKAAATAGRGNSYVYVMVNNDSFYFAGVVEADAELTVDFPEGYVFRNEVEVRKSYYTPKRPKKGAEGGADDSIQENTEGEGEATYTAEDQTQYEEVPATEGAAAEEAPAPAKRKGRR